jgi:hypothetical protein
MPSFGEQEVCGDAQGETQPLRSAMNQALLPLKARRWGRPAARVDLDAAARGPSPHQCRSVAVAGPHLLLAKSRTPRIADGSVRPRLGSANSSSGSCKHVSSHAGVDAST